MLFASTKFQRLCFAILTFFLMIAWPVATSADKNGERHLLYVATPGIRNYLEFGGHGLLVFDIDDGHKLLKRIKTSGFDKEGKPLNVKGIVANAKTHRVFITTTETLQSIDLLTEKILWEKPYEGGTDRLAIDPNGKFIYVPSLEKDHWHVVDAATGDIIKKLVPKSGAHNTIVSLDGKWAYLAGLKSPVLNISDTSKHEITKTVGPFSSVIRPFTINGSQTLAYVNVNDLLGFEIGDIRTGKMLARVEVTGFQKGPTKRHGCPSHGVALTPDEKEVWIADAFNQRVHVFDNTVMPPKQIASLPVREQRRGRQRLRELAEPQRWQPDGERHRERVGRHVDDRGLGHPERSGSVLPGPEPTRWRQRRALR